MGFSQVERILKIATHALARRSDEPPLVHFEESGQTFKVGVGVYHGGLSMSCNIRKKLRRDRAATGLDFSASGAAERDGARRVLCAAAPYPSQSSFNLCPLPRSTVGSCLSESFAGLCVCFSLDRALSHRLKWNCAFLMRHLSPFSFFYFAVVLSFITLTSQ